MLMGLDNAIVVLALAFILLIVMGVGVVIALARWTQELPTASRKREKKGNCHQNTYSPTASHN